MEYGMIELVSDDEYIEAMLYQVRPTIWLPRYITQFPRIFRLVHHTNEYWKIISLTDYRLKVAESIVRPGEIQISDDYSQLSEVGRPSELIRFFSNLQSMDNQAGLLYIDELFKRWGK